MITICCCLVLLSCNIFECHCAETSDVVDSLDDATGDDTNSSRVNAERRRQGRRTGGRDARRIAGRDQRHMRNRGKRGSHGE